MLFCWHHPCKRATQLGPSCILRQASRIERAADGGRREGFLPYARRRCAPTGWSCSCRTTTVAREVVAQAQATWNPGKVPPSVTDGNREPGWCLRRINKAEALQAGALTAARTRRTCSAVQACSPSCPQVSTGIVCAYQVRLEARLRRPSYGTVGLHSCGTSAANAQARRVTRMPDGLSRRRRACDVIFRVRYILRQARAALAHGCDGCDDAKSPIVAR